MPVPLEVRALERYRIWVKYSDGTEGIVDKNYTRLFYCPLWYSQ